MELPEVALLEWPLVLTVSRVGRPAVDPARSSCSYVPCLYAERSVPMMFGSCLALGALVGTFDAAGKTFNGTAPHATPTSVASEGHQDEGHGAGEPGWREQREARRASFFKVSSEAWDRPIAGFAR